MTFATTRYQRNVKLLTASLVLLGISISLVLGIIVA